MDRRAIVALLLLAGAGAFAGCGGASSANSPRVRERRLADSGEPERPSSVTVVPANEETKPEPFVATSGPGDVPVAYVRDERSSRLDVPLPKGGAKEEWRMPLGPPRREPCAGVCPPLRASFVLAAGNRVAVTGADGWALFDTDGRRLDAGKTDATVRLDRASGVVVPDETRSADLPADAKTALHKGLVVMVNGGGVHVGERAIEGSFDAIDVAMDGAGTACVVVRQSEDLVLWTVPLASGGGIGRQRIIGGGRRALGPPVLGNKLRVFVVDTGLLARGLDGRRVWERRGAPTGGISITSDDHVLVADGGKILAIDSRVRVTELFSAPGTVFVTPPILDARGVLFVASGQSLHALSFS
ncbi:MAG: hypothetical protein BGO98_37770 [Myxococcales bacterium 68-20]|nr:MAG: hypothetical protein BGO98_37770 [Myxococcales bacterium 68-20]